VAKNFKDLSEQEILALAISSEEMDARIYEHFAEGLKADYPATSRIFKELEAAEDEHRRELIEEYRRHFGEHIPWVRREDMKGFVHRKPVWMIRSQLYL
jgi:rubrerythrin